jgi:hypothetical protein
MTVDTASDDARGLHRLCQHGWDDRGETKKGVNRSACRRRRHAGVVLWPHGADAHIAASRSTEEVRMKKLKRMERMERMRMKMKMRVMRMTMKS